MVGTQTCNLVYEFANGKFGGLVTRAVPLPRGLRGISRATLRSRSRPVNVVRPSTSVPEDMVEYIKICKSI